ncbi:MAG: ATP-binding cassette domain-containing protein, partial [Lachnospiraceae bacterium]|nr:ATP-binding cassette domain-containing protein [Lachnospiraceae bacterium]
MIKVNNLKKCYSDKPVISDISFTISENGVYGFLGPNGAGKSTT